MRPESHSRTGRSFTQPPPAPRLTWKPTGGPVGHVDGAWWPRSRDLGAELPGLATALTARLGYLTRVAYTVSEWDRAPRRAELGGQVVRLDGLLDPDRHVLFVTGPQPHRLTLLVVPPEATNAAGHCALLLASRCGNTDRCTDILAGCGALTAPTPHWRRNDTTEDDWETEGGRFC